MSAGKGFAAIQEDGNESRPLILMYQESWGRGGIEAFAMELIRNLDEREFAIELFSAYDWDNSYDDELSERGVVRNVVFSGGKPGYVRRFISGSSAWRQRLCKGDVDIVHVNAMNGVTLVYVAIAKKMGVAKRIAHSHNTSFSGGMRFAKTAIHRLGRLLWGGAATRRLACSQEAGLYLFGKREYYFIPNGIDVERFRFNNETRRLMRDNLGVGDRTLVFGSLGRLSYQKNPLLSVEVLAELERQGVDAVLLLVGNGELEDLVDEKVLSLGLEERYIHLSSVANPEDYYSAMDVFLAPSLFEGFGYTLLEAQCSGLPVVASDAIQNEVCVTDLVEIISLQSSVQVWCDCISQASNAVVDREQYADIIVDGGFSVDDCVAAMKSAYA